MCYKPLVPGGVTLTEGWRTAGTDTFTLVAHPDVTNPVITKDHITDLTAYHVADPFYIKVGAVHYLFYEVFVYLTADTSTAYIAYSTSVDGLVWAYGGFLGVVGGSKLASAYPCVYEVDGAYWMIPHFSTTYRDLYRAIEFPARWMKWERMITADYSIRDGSLFQWEGYFYLYVGKRSASPEQTDLYIAPTLYGSEWTLHPASPILNIGNAAWRPGGRPIVRPEIGVDIYVQDESVTYGGSLRAFRLSNLSPTTCTVTELENSPVLSASGVDAAWNKDGMHTLDRVSPSLSIVDGKILNGDLEPIWSIGIFYDDPS